MILAWKTASNEARKNIVRREAARRLARLGGTEPGMPFIVGNARTLLGEIAAPPVGRTETFLACVATRKLFSRGIGFVDCHLLLSAVLSGDSKIWTNDKRLLAVVRDMGLH